MTNEAANAAVTNEAMSPVLTLGGDSCPPGKAVNVNYYNAANAGQDWYFYACLPPIERLLGRCPHRIRIHVRVQECEPPQTGWQSAPWTKARGDRVDCNAAPYWQFQGLEGFKTLEGFRPSEGIVFTIWWTVEVLKENA